MVNQGYRGTFSPCGKTDSVGHQPSISIQELCQKSKTGNKNLFKKLTSLNFKEIRDNQTQAFFKSELLNMNIFQTKKPNNSYQKLLLLSRGKNCLSKTFFISTSSTINSFSQKNKKKHQLS